METTDTEIAELEKSLHSEGLSPGPPNARPSNNGLSSTKVRAVLIGLVLLIAVVTIAGIIYYRDRVSTDDAQVDGHIVPVASKIYGTVVEVLVRDNEQVKTGQVLARIDARDYQMKVDQARAALALAESQLQAASLGVPLTRETTEGGTSVSEAQVASAESEFARARLSHDLYSTSEIAAAQAVVEARQAANDRAQADLARMRPLADKAEISRQQLDAYLASARVSESELKAAQEKLTSARKEADIRRATMLAAKANVEQARAGLQVSKARMKQTDISAAQAVSAGAAVGQAKANLSAAELQLGYTTIVSAVDGVITKKTVETGQIVQPGQGLLTVVPLDQVWVTANFKETQLANVRPGHRAEVKVDMYGASFGGHVDSISGATGTRLSLLPPENATGNYVKVVQRIPVKIVLDPIPPDKAVLRPGMNVDATIFTR